MRRERPSSPCTAEAHRRCRHVEGGKQHHRGPARQHAVSGDEQPVGVKERKDVKQHVVFGEAPRIDQRLGVVHEVPVRQQRTFRAPGRP